VRLELTKFRLVCIVTNIDDTKPLRRSGPSRLDYADDVALLSEMLVVLITAMEVIHEEASLFGMEINNGRRRRSRVLVFKTVQPLCK